jgi:hypothetical protein
MDPRELANLIHRTFLKLKANINFPITWTHLGLFVHIAWAEESKRVFKHDKHFSSNMIIMGIHALEQVITRADTVDV